MVIFYLLRLMYFGERRADGEFTGWAKFGALAWTLFFINKAANTLTRQRVVFALRLLITAATIVPLWVITAQTNDQTTSLYTVLTTAFILIYGYVKNILASRKASQTETLLNDETIALCKAYNARSSDARQMIQRIAVEDFTVPKRAPLTAEKAFDIDAQLGYAVAEIEELGRQRFYWAYGVAFIIALSAWSIHHQKKAMFEFGYATGYTDGKAGAKPKSETSWDRVALCHNRDWREGPAPDSCFDEPQK
jgi:small-conductance mechanosensitive channel